MAKIKSDAAKARKSVTEELSKNWREHPDVDGRETVRQAGPVETAIDLYSKNAPRHSLALAVAWSIGIADGCAMAVACGFVTGQAEIAAVSARSTAYRKAAVALATFLETLEPGKGLTTSEDEASSIYEAAWKYVDKRL